MTHAEMAYKTVQQGQGTDQEQLVMGEIPQVYYIARRIHERLPQHVALEDLVHSGVLGLIDAVRNFDASKNVQFKSYAQFRIRGAILDSLRELDWASRRTRDKRKQVDQTIAALSLKLGRDPTDEEMAAELGIELTALHQLLGKLDSLNMVGQQVAYGEDNEQHDLIESAPAQGRGQSVSPVPAHRNAGPFGGRHRVAFRKRTAGNFPLLSRRVDHEGDCKRAGYRRVARVATSFSGFEKTPLNSGSGVGTGS